MKKNNKNGFTLIELLGVIVILGIIALIVTPPIINNIKKSDDTVKTSNLEYVYSTGESYIKDNSNSYPMNEGAELCIKVEELMNDNRFKEGTLKDGNIDPNKYLLYTIGKNGKISYELNLYNDQNCEKFGKAKLIAGTITSNSIAVAMQVETDETNLKYEFSIDGGNTWTSKSVSNQYTFTKLKNGLDYYILGRTTNTENETIVASIRLRTLDIGMPEYTAEPDLSIMSQKKVITIHYPERQSNFIFEYSLDLGKTWIEVPTGTTKDITFTGEGTITARVRDGYNVVTARTLTIVFIDGDAPSVPTAKIRYNNSTGKEKTNDTTWVNNTLWWGEFKSTDVGLGVDHFEYSEGCTGKKTGDLKQSYIYSKDTNKTYCIRAVDKAGNASDWSKPYYIKVDKTKPTCGTITLNGTAGTNGWYRSNVTVSKTNGSDALSGHKSTTLSHTSLTSETSGTTVTLTTTDNAGNKCTTTKTVKIDKTNPKCGTITLSGTVGSNGWYRSNVTVSKANGSDALSGHASTTVSHSSITSDTKGTTVTLTTKDKAGNSCSTTKTVKVDKTKPTCGTISFSGTSGNNGWYRSTVTVNKSNGSDATSGHASTTVSHSSVGNTTGTTVTLTTRDNAGNSCSTSKTVKVDATKPNAGSVVLQKTNGSNGNRGDVIGGYSAGTWSKNYVLASTTGSSDSYSGVAKREVVVVAGSASGNGTFQQDSRSIQASGTSNLYYKITDNAGNVSTTPTYTIRIDRKKVSLTYSVKGAATGKNYGSTTGKKTINIPVSSDDCPNGTNETLSIKNTGPSTDTYYYNFSSTSPWNNGNQISTKTFNPSNGVPNTYAGEAGNKGPGGSYIGSATGVLTIWSVDQAGNTSNKIIVTTNWCIK